MSTGPVPFGLVLFKMASSFEESLASEVENLFHTVFSLSQILVNKLDCYIAGIFPATARPFIG